MSGDRSPRNACPSCGAPLVDFVVPAGSEFAGERYWLCPNALDHGGGAAAPTCRIHARPLSVRRGERGRYLGCDFWWCDDCRHAPATRPDSSPDTSDRTRKHAAQAASAKKFVESVLGPDSLRRKQEVESRTAEWRATRLTDPRGLWNQHEPVPGYGALCWVDVAFAGGDGSKRRPAVVRPQFGAPSRFKAVPLYTLRPGRTLKSGVKVAANPRGIPDRDCVAGRPAVVDAADLDPTAWCMDEPAAALLFLRLGIGA